MQPFVALTAVACPLPFANIDTDQLIPARFMRRPRAAGYGPFLLHDVRRRPDGELDPEFPLNRPLYQDARILVTRRNFGGGSSREAAVYALADFGFRVVIAPSFGDIFASNAVKNGVLPALVEESVSEDLLAALASSAARACSIDLPTQFIRVGEVATRFSIDPTWKQQLLNGWDDIDLTLNEAPAIAAFRTRDEAARPWASPRRPKKGAPQDALPHAAQSDSKVLRLPVR
jgi:3-isopropylmalate/(R)-2-methylmalate dehydratase small subunit